MVEVLLAVERVGGEVGDAGMWGAADGGGRSVDEVIGSFLEGDGVGGWQVSIADRDGGGCRRRVGE